MMNLKEKFREDAPRVIPRFPSREALEQIKAGKKFIPVEKAFDTAYLPDDYLLIDIQYKAESFHTIVPLNVMIYMSNPGEGDLDDALDEISDFYDEVKDFEDDRIDHKDVSVQGTNWAVTARSSYRTYLTNKLTRAGKDGMDAPVWNEDTLNRLDLNDDYVIQRVRAMAAVALGLDIEQVKTYEVDDVLKHVTINERRVENLTVKEFDNIACWAGSHYEIKDEFMGRDDAEYEIERNHYKGHKVGKKIIKKYDVELFDSGIDDLEHEIAAYRKPNTVIREGMTAA